MMTSLEIVQKLKEAIESDIKALKQEVEQEKSKTKILQEENEELSRNVKELRGDNSSLIKTLKELKEKYGRLHDKLKRKQEEIHKKEKWWDKYRLTAETTLKKIRKLGTFSPEVLHEVSRDLVDIMEDESSSTETVSSQESQTKKSLKKLTTKDRKKKFRYEDVSPEQLDSTNRKAQQKQKENNTCREENHAIDKMHSSQRSSSSSSSKSNPGSMLKETSNDVDNDETNAEGLGCPSLTSTPVFSSTQSKISVQPPDFPDFSMIVQDKVSSAKPSQDVMGVNTDNGSNFKKNLRIVIKDFNKPENKNDFRESTIRQNTEKLGFTSIQVNEEERAYPSILPQETKLIPQLSSKQSNEIDKKRFSTSSSSMNEVKRQKRDHGQGCSVVLLSSDEEDNTKMGSSVDMFGENENSHSKSRIKDKNSKPDMNYTVAEKSSNTSSLSSKVGKEVKSEELLDDDPDDFPGFRKPDEPTFKNIEVVRKKDERLKLKGFSCRECAEYYGSLNLNEDELKKRLKKCSRHRAKHSPPPSTPPGFWNLSFPETQEYMAKGMLRTEENGPQLPKRKHRRRRLLGKNRLVIKN